MAKRLAELGALQDAVSNNESNPSRLGLAGYIRGLFLDWSANPYNPLTRLSARGRLLGYFWDSGAIGLSMDFANQNFIVKDGTLQSKPFSDIVNFSRTSNATVTDSAGVITYAPHNLLLASEQFDSSSWVNNASSEQSNVILSPNNTITADKLIEDSTTDVHTTTQTLTKVASVITYTYSIYVKGGLGRNVQLSLDGGTTTNRSTANFDIANGVVGSVLNFGTFTAGSNQIEALSNNWYRCSLTTTTGTETSIRARATLLNGTTSSYAGDGTSGIYLWGAQLEIGSTATTYNPTTVKNLLGYSELFDNAAWTKSNSFVQTNLVNYSESFDNAYWLKSNTTITENSIIAPNGYQTADTHTTTSTLNSYFYRANVGTLVNGQTYTASRYVKAGTKSFCTIGLHNLADAYFDLDLLTYSFSGTGAVSASIVDVGNGWRRISATWTWGAGTTYSLYFAMASSLSSTGGLTIGDTIYTWGAQLVQGSVAGDYRRTDAAALPVYYANHNGVVCAEKLVENTATGQRFAVSTLPTVAIGSVNTSSIYVKAAERSWVILFDLGSATGRYFDISNGTKGNTFIGVPTSDSITPVGDGWYRISITGTATGTTGGFRLYLANANNSSSYTGDGTSGIYIFGAQLSDSASLDPYVLNAAAAPTAAAYYGARFDYDPVTLQPEGLLIEEQRSNALLNSSILGLPLSTQAVTVGAVPWTLSFYGTGTVAITGTYTGSLVGTGAYPTRSTLTFTPTAGIILLTVTGNVQFAQLEAGAFATSYIPTAASQVTRTADVASIQGSNFYSWYNQNEGSYTINSNPLMLGNNALTFNNGSNANRIATVSGVNNHLYISFDSAVQASIDAGTYTVNTDNKLSAAYNTNDFACCLNNSTVGTDSSGNVPIISTLALGRDGASSGYINGTIKSLSYYPTRLNNDTLKGLTA